MSITRTFSTALAAVAFLALAACGSASTGTSAETLVGTSDPPSRELSSSEPSVDRRSPLTIALSDGNSVEDLIALTQREARLRDEFMWECLGAFGFDWFDSSTAMDHLDASHYDDAPIPAIVDGSYGIVPADLDIEWAVEDIFEPLIASRAIEGPGAGLSDREAEAFWPRAEECSAQANEEVRLQPQISTELSVAMSDLADRIASDPRSVEAIASWSRCMNESGLDYADPVDLYSDLSSEFSMLRPSAVVFPVEARASIRLLVDSDPEELIRLVREQGSIDPQMFDLQEREQEVATVDAACRGDLEETLLRIRDEYHGSFMAENDHLLRSDQ